MAVKNDGRDPKTRILSACVRMFIERGYKNTKMLDILEQAEVAAGTFQNIFRTKDGVLLDLAQAMFENQFGIAAEIVGETPDTALVYSVETAIQLAIAEQNENLREIYVEAYTQPKVMEFILQRTSTKVYELFAKYMPDCSESDFYELNIGTAGIMRAYMVRKCDKYFTLNKKIERFLFLALRAYNVPQPERDKIVGFIQKLDIKEVSAAVMQKLFRALAMKFDFSPDF